jgi:hypothetical protein
LAQVYGTEQAKKIGLAQAAATRQAGLDVKEGTLTGAYSKQASDLYNKWYTILQNGEMKTHFEVHPEDLDKAAEIMVYKSLPQVARDRLNLVDPRTAPPSNSGSAPVAPATEKPTTSAAMPATPKIPQVTSPADYVKIPPGSVYIDPTGVQRTKPLA